VLNIFVLNISHSDGVVFHVRTVVHIQKSNVLILDSLRNAHFGQVFKQTAALCVLRWTILQSEVKERSREVLKSNFSLRPNDTFYSSHKSEPDGSCHETNAGEHVSSTSQRRGIFHFVFTHLYLYITMT
jgi:hypothetical protein